ncbi:MAG: hypothetical protein KDC98_03285 [Planctomycetes bacterium]|nr:hypothetical protein [Planctomycetota bacterium]
MRLLSEVLVGDRPAEDPEVIAAAGASASFRQSLVELRSLQGRLDAEGRRERELLAEAGGAPDDGLTAPGAGPDLVSRTIARLAAEPVPSAESETAAEPGQDVRRWPRLVLFAGLAAAALFLIWAFVGFGSGRMPDDQRQLGSPYLDLEPAKVEADAVTLSWAFTLPMASGPVLYTVRIFDPADPGFAVDSEELENSTWVIDRTDFDGWPAGAHWEVTARYRRGVYRKERALR